MDSKESAWQAESPGKGKLPGLVTKVGMVAVPLCTRDYARNDPLTQGKEEYNFIGENIMLRKLAFLAILAVILAAAYGAAAALGLNGGVIQAGTDDTLACDPDGVETQWETFLTNGKFHVQAVEINGIHPDCIGKYALVALMEGPTQMAGMMRVPTAISGTTAKATQCYGTGGWGACAIPVEDVNIVNVVFKSAFVAYDAP